jgi:hypothetical protein
VAKKAVTSEKIQVPAARLAFANLDKPDFFTPGKPKDDKEIPMHRAQLILDPTSALHVPVIKKIEAEGDRIANVYWEGKPPKKLGHGYGTEEDLNKVYDGFAGMFWVRVASKGPLSVVGRRREGPIDVRTGKPTFIPLTPKDSEWPYNGCYVNATITLWTQDSHGRTGINGNLLAVQFVKKGEAFGGQRTSADDEFEALEDEDTTDAFDDPLND